MDHQPSLLVLIIDANAEVWKHRAQYGNDSQTSLNSFIKELIIFCNSYCLLHRFNRLIILANHPNQVKQIFPPVSFILNAVNEPFVPKLHELAKIICNGLLEVAGYDLSENHTTQSINPNDNKEFPKSTLANSLSVALCSKLFFIIFND